MLDRVRSILKAESDAISSLVIAGDVEAAIKSIVACQGKLFTTGIGKAGYVAKKAASTFCTTGTPSVFLHPGDASHGDVGVVSSGDVLLAFSNSGRTREVIETAEFCKRLHVDAVIGMCSSKGSPLGELSDIVLELGDIKEPCPLGFTPSASTTAMIALSDALALTVMEERGFSAEDFALRHHGGYLRRKKPSQGFFDRLDCCSWQLSMSVF